MAGLLALPSRESGQVRKEAATAMQVSAEGRARHLSFYKNPALFLCTRSIYPNGNLEQLLKSCNITSFLRPPLLE